MLIGFLSAGFKVNKSNQGRNMGQF
jgi:hypothetical protein